eukprot:5235115-Pyramimonas_sp.AAC.1
MYIGKADLHCGGRHPGSGLVLRLTEHLRAIIRPAGREGSLSRYAGLRRAMGSLSYLPIETLSSSPRAFALEGLLVRTLRPPGN